MDMAGLVLGASTSLTCQRSDIIIVINDGRSRCCGFGMLLVLGTEVV
jgi:hypothetical protein